MNKWLYRGWNKNYNVSKGLEAHIVIKIKYMCILQQVISAPITKCSILKLEVQYIIDHVNAWLNMHLP